MMKMNEKLETLVLETIFDKPIISELRLVAEERGTDIFSVIVTSVLKELIR